MFECSLTNQHERCSSKLQHLVTVHIAAAQAWSIYHESCPWTKISFGVAFLSCKTTFNSNKLTPKAGGNITKWRYTFQPNTSYLLVQCRTWKPFYNGKHDHKFCSKSVWFGPHGDDQQICSCSITTSSSWISWCYSLISPFQVVMETRRETYKWWFCLPT